MKQTLIQVLSLLLCLVLLVVLLGQNRQMQVQIDQLEYEVHQLRSSLTEEVRSVSSQVRQELEESQRVVADYSLQPKEVSQEEQALLADVRVSLKEWFSDTQVTLLARVGAETAELPTEGDGKGGFAARLAIPLGPSQEVRLTAKISGGGKHRSEELGSWSDIAQLLPLRNSGGGWDGPNYRDGTMSSSFNISIEGRDGVPGPIENPRFRIYRNGELVQTVSAVVDPYASATNGVCYTTETQGYRWQLECDPGDTVDIRFLCEDEYGLGYDFLFANWTASEDRNGTYNGSTFQSGSYALSLYWPE